MTNDALLICVVGPTAIGKTRLAIELAQHYNTEILSADSRQFFKEMEIGTAVPSAEELAAAPHHFIQHRSVEADYTVGDFEKEAIEKLESLFEKHRVAILVGGSGLYVDAVVRGLDEFPTIDPQVRKTLNEEFETNGIESLQKELKTVDKQQFDRIDTENPRRLIRALEVYRSSGQPYSSFLRKHKTERAFRTIYIGLTAPRPIIYDRINRRVDLMMKQGLLQEVETLLPFKSTNALQTVGYRELFSYLEGTFTLDQAIEEIKKNTRRFAKRQGTWFRKNPDIQWFDYDEPTKHIIEHLHKKTRP
ncbi:MAG: tRNA (adenosine(37)-N6)-dimethylallyltransferase MiaA [Flavobacteriaceae bacterium]|nr:tRNA (adenosine(37)-N6)-dimethylallyltransferase MiaA [Flavobacteriaceae bacterium]